MKEAAMKVTQRGCNCGGFPTQPSCQGLWAGIVDNASYPTMDI